MFTRLVTLYFFIVGGFVTVQLLSNNNSNGYHNDPVVSNENEMQGSLRILKRYPRIVGGNKITIDNVPFLVNIRRNGVFECGGSLMTPNCVLTAAHCIKTGTPDDFVVRAGVTHLTERQNSRRVLKIFKPDIFDNKTLDYDIAIFKLRSNFENMQTIELPQHDFILNASMPLNISGWGLPTESARLPSKQVQTAEVLVWPHTLCQQLYKHYRNVTERMFCASIPGYKDACAADSGGPAVANGKLLGIVSWGKGFECARAVSPGVYVNVAKVRPWIDEVMQMECL